MGRHNNYKHESLKREYVTHIELALRRPIKLPSILIDLYYKANITYSDDILYDWQSIRWSIIWALCIHVLDGLVDDILVEILDGLINYLFNDLFNDLLDGLVDDL